MPACSPLRQRTEVGYGVMLTLPEDRQHMKSLYTSISSYAGEDS